VKALSEKLQTVRASFAPRPKFTFKSALKNRSSPASSSGALTNPPSSLNPKKPASVAKDEIEEQHVEAANKKIREFTIGNGIRRVSFSSASSISLNNHKNAYIAVQRSASEAACGLGKVADIDHCVIDLKQPSYADSPYPGLTVLNVSKSLLLCGKVSGAIHMTNLQDCVLVVACRQFRMHECKNVTVYLHCGSRPIIEDCERVRFTPLPKPYVCFASKRSHPSSGWPQC
jgi:tubulin-specific chaperone C